MACNASFGGGSSVSARKTPMLVSLLLINQSNSFIFPSTSMGLTPSVRFGLAISLASRWTASILHIQRKPSSLTEFDWWAWVDLNHRPHPYQLSKGILVMDCDFLLLRWFFAPIQAISALDLPLPVATKIDLRWAQKWAQPSWCPYWRGAWARASLGKLLAFFYFCIFCMN